MDMNKYNIEDMIPHRDRMKLIDKIINIDENEAVTSTIIKENWPLVNENYANPIIIIELIAQTAGILEGYIKLKQEDIGVSGWLAGIKEANFLIDKIPLNKELTISASKSYQMENLGIVKGDVKLGEKTIGNAVLQAIQA